MQELRGNKTPRYLQRISPDNPVAFSFAIYARKEFMRMTQDSAAIEADGPSDWPNVLLIITFIALSDVLLY